MNDHQYRPYEERIGRAYREYSTAIVRAFKANGVEVVMGSPGCVGKMPSWVKSATGTVDDLNRNLATLRNIGLEVARDEQSAFGDVFTAMTAAGSKAGMLYGTNYAIAGRDGVHPGWSGQTVMAYAFLKALGLNGEIAMLTIDLEKGNMKASTGHSVRKVGPSRFEVTSTRYPFCPCAPDELSDKSYPNCGKDDVSRDDSIRSALTLVPFNAELNRFMLVGRKGKAPFYKVTWHAPGKDGASKVYSSAELARGINLVEEFPLNPFSESFARVDAAVLAKQAHETRQVKEVFHGAEGKANMEGAVARTEAERGPLLRAVQRAFQPVTHTIVLEPAKER
jgi:hypothetical protein